jgi:hypothetical protein
MWKGTRRICQQEDKPALMGKTEATGEFTHHTTTHNTTASADDATDGTVLGFPQMTNNSTSFRPSVASLLLLLLLLLERSWREAHHCLALAHFPRLIHQLHHFKMPRNAFSLARVHFAKLHVVNIASHELLSGNILIKANVPALLEYSIRQVKHYILLKRLTNHHLCLHVTSFL